MGSLSVNPPKIFSLIFREKRKFKGTKVLAEKKILISVHLERFKLFFAANENRVLALVDRISVATINASCFRVFVDV